VRAVGDSVVSILARVEVPAALWRKHRIGELSAKDAGVLSAAFELDLFGDANHDPRLVAVAVAGEVLEWAAHLVGSEPLRAYDGVQLASALVAREADPDLVRFACFDRDLRDAAARHGFALIPA
jgi:predicted nucleic acid-binding protein